MKKKYSFHYEVRFRLISFDSDGKFNIQSYTEKCSEDNPLEARKKAFQTFDEFLSFPFQTGRIIKDSRGNYKIVKPTFVVQELKKIEEKDFSIKSDVAYDNSLNHEELSILRKLAMIEIEKMSAKDNVLEQFKEEVAIFLVIDDKKLLEKIEGNGYYEQFETEEIKMEYEIHKVSSTDIYEQLIVDELENVELEIYKHYNIDISNIASTVYHYGLDYSESGEDEEFGAKREILATPYIWNTLDNYINSNNNIRSTEIELDNFNYLDIIEKGESHYVEFKPTLVYNFKTGKGSIAVKYIIAKAICGFLNSNGGMLFIGVKDSGEVQGLDFDYSLYSSENKKDKILLDVDSMISNFIGISIKPLIISEIENINGKDVLVITVEKGNKPILLKNKRDGILKKELFVRMNASTRKITDMEELIDYMFNNWKNEE